MTKFTFHRDRFGVHVYYADMNQEIRKTLRPSLQIVINNTHKFYPNESAVIPPVTRVSSVRKEDQLVGFINTTSGQKMSIQAHDTERVRLEREVAIFKGATKVSQDQVLAELNLRTFESNWVEENQEIEVHSDYEFEIVDIDYPADDRMTPMRHFDQAKVNYFEVKGVDITRRFAHELCSSAGLKFASAPKYNEFNFSDYGFVDYIKINGKSYPIKYDVAIRSSFIGNMDECREYISRIECSIRNAFDEWQINDRKPNGLTIGLVTEQLDKLYKMVSMIESKIKTANKKTAALQAITLMRTEIVHLGLEDLKANEDFDEKLLTDSTAGV